MEYSHSYAEQSKETCGLHEAVRLKFHTHFVFPVMTGAVKPKRDVLFSVKNGVWGRTIRWELSFARMKNTENKQKQAMRSKKE